MARRAQVTGQQVRLATRRVVAHVEEHERVTSATRHRRRTEEEDAQEGQVRKEVRAEGNASLLSVEPAVLAHWQQGEPLRLQQHSQNSDHDRGEDSGGGGASARRR